MKKPKEFSLTELLASKKDVLLPALKNCETQLQHKRITAGFDGFIDTIGGIIKKKQATQSPSFFKTIKQFGEYITSKQAASFSLEMEEHNVRPGGNMPIMSQTLANLGASVNCIGALGYPEINPVFSTLADSCELYSFAEPGYSTAFEFQDGKMFLAKMGALNKTGWKEIKDILGLEKIRSLFTDNDMVCLLNWSEIDASADIWKGLLADVFTTYPKNKKQYIFVDLSDCSKRPKDAVVESIGLLTKFSQYGEVILSLNKNEAAVISKLLLGKKDSSDFYKKGLRLFELLSLHTLLIHSSTKTIGFRSEQQAIIPTFYTAKPFISTGAGDNFNAGFCIAQLLDLDIASAILFANAVSGIYIRTGKPATMPETISFLQSNNSWK